jgi:hypothetical protein
MMSNINIDTAARFDAKLYVLAIDLGSGAIKVALMTFFSNM